MGAWIEIVVLLLCSSLRLCRTPHGCVDWNISNSIAYLYESSRTPHGCVDWNNLFKSEQPPCFCRTPHGCVDWNWCRTFQTGETRGRTPHGCVDWNKSSNLARFSIKVAPHMGAWIEIAIRLACLSLSKSHPTWVRGLKYINPLRTSEQLVSHPTWVRGLKYWYPVQTSHGQWSHPTWVRGLK